MNGLDPCPRCGHDMELVYGDRITRRMSCWWCRMADNEAHRKAIGVPYDVLRGPEPDFEAARFDLARQGMERVVADLEAEGAWI